MPGLRCKSAAKAGLEHWPSLAPAPLAGEGVCASRLSERGPSPTPLARHLPRVDVGWVAPTGSPGAGYAVHARECAGPELPGDSLGTMAVETAPVAARHMSLSFLVWNQGANAAQNDRKIGAL